MVQITPNNIHIPDSYLIKTRQGMKDYLTFLKANNPDCEVFKRPISGLIAEWRAHTLF